MQEGRLAVARIRTIKPEFFTSPDTAKCAFPVRILFQAMWCWADDFGIGETNINGLLGFAFCDSDGFTAQDVRRFCADIARNFGVTFYEVRGRYYYAVPTWEEHQKLERRTSRRKYPTPDDPEAAPDLRILDCADSAPNLRRECAEDSPLEQGKGNRGRGTGEQEPPYPPRLETIGAVAVVETPGAKSRRARIDAINDTARPAAVYTLMHDYEQASPTPISPKMRSQIEEAITPLMAEGIPAEQIAAGIRLWEASDINSPTQLHLFVHKAGAKASAPATATPSKVSQWAELANDFAAAEADQARKELA